MPLKYKMRRRLSLAVLLIALPVYIIVAVNLMDWLRMRYEGINPLVELVVFVAIGILWVLPFRKVFRGVGLENPDGNGDGRK